MIKLHFFKTTGSKQKKNRLLNFRRVCFSCEDGAFILLLTDFPYNPMPCPTTIQQIFQHLGLVWAGRIQEQQQEKGGKILFYLHFSVYSLNNEELSKTTNRIATMWHACWELFDMDCYQKDVFLQVDTAFAHQAAETVTFVSSHILTWFLYTSSCYLSNVIPLNSVRNL